MKKIIFLIGLMVLIYLAGSVSAQVVFNPSTPANGAVVGDPGLVVNISTGSLDIEHQYHVLVNDYNKFQVGQPYYDPVDPLLYYTTGTPPQNYSIYNIIKPFVNNVTFSNNIISDSAVGSYEPIVRIYGNVWTTGNGNPVTLENDITKKEYTAKNNVYYRENNDYLFYDGHSSAWYQHTTNLNDWMSYSGETGSITPTNPSTLLNIMENPTLPEDNPSSYFKTATSEAIALSAGAEWDMTQEPWITWFPQDCSSEGSTSPCTVDDYDRVHNGIRTCTGGKWGECDASLDYTESEICYPADLAHCYFIDPVFGSDSGDGSMASPWKTLNTVFTIDGVYATKVSLTSYSGNKTVVLRDGTFNVCSAASTSTCISVDGPRYLTIRNYPGEHPRIVGPIVGNLTILIGVGSWTPPGTSNVFIDGLDLQGGSYWVFKFEDSAQNITLRNCKIHGSGADVVASKGREYTTLSHNTIENCEIYNSSLRDPTHGSADEGIDIMMTGWLTVRNNYIHDITGNCLYFKGSSKYGLVEDNFCYNSGISNLVNPLIADSWGGIWYGEANAAMYNLPYPEYYSAINGTIRNNILAECHGNAFRAMGSKDAQFYNNTLYNKNRQVARYSGSYGGGFAAVLGEYTFTQYAGSDIEKDGVIWNASYDVVLNWDGVDQDRFLLGLITFAGIYNKPFFIYPTNTDDWTAPINMTLGTHTYYVKVRDSSRVDHQTETRTITYLPGANPDVNSDGSINIIDLAIVAFNQGHDPVGEPEYSHLDLDGNGFINFDDVRIVMGSIF